jgi:hypothetical protein
MFVLLPFLCIYSYLQYNAPTIWFFIIRNNILSDKLMKSFGMRYSTSYADPGLKMRNTFAFGYLDFKVRPGDPATNSGLHRQSNLPRSLHRPWLLQSFYRTIQCKTIFSAQIVSLDEPQTWATNGAHRGANSSAIHHDSPRSWLRNNLEC